MLNPIGNEAGPLRPDDQLILLSRVFLDPSQPLPTDPSVRPRHRTRQHSFNGKMRTEVNPRHEIRHWNIWVSGWRRRGTPAGAMLGVRRVPQNVRS
jgi:hypothetical protein